jgi:hypothetical protein
MPIRTQSMSARRAGDARFSELKGRLAAEWRNPGDPGPGAPDILRETDTKGRVVHIYVTWDDWEDLDPQVRSEMIVDVFQEIEGESAVIDLTLAMGLTGQEARRLGLSVA